MTEKTTKVPSTDELVDILLPDDKSGKSVTPATPKTKTIKIEEDISMQSEKIMNLPINKLAEFENHPFRVQQDEDFQKLVDSIKENGILIPAVARPKGDGYELIAGHRRKFACQILGIETMPVLVRELTNEQAVISMVDSNVQRENILPSEKAFAYKMKLDALNRQGKRSDLTSTPAVSKFRTNEKVGSDSGDSREQVRRYVRLTELIPQLLRLVDEGKIGFRPAVELSYLPKEQQTLLLSAMEAEESTPSLAQALRLKTLCGEGTLNEDSIIDVIREQKANQKEQLKIPYDRVREIIKTDMPPKALEDYIIKAVADYYKRQKARESRESAR